MRQSPSGTGLHANLCIAMNISCIANDIKIGDWGLPWATTVATDPHLHCKRHDGHRKLAVQAASFKSREVQGAFSSSGVDPAAVSNRGR